MVNSLMLTGVSTFNIPVKDYKKAIEFYTGNLGMILVTNEPSFDHYELVPANSKGPTLCLCEGGKPLDDVAGIIFRTDNIQATYREFNKSDVKVTEPYEAHGEWWSGFKSPDGNAYGIHQENE